MLKLQTKPDLRERVIEKGFLYPSDEELIMLIIGSGTKTTPVQILATRILNCIDKTKTSELLDKLTKIKGIGKSKALAVTAAIELGRRKSQHLGASIRHPCDVIPYVKHFAMKSQEHFICITLSGAHEIMRIDVVSVGTVNRAIVHPREVFTNPIRDKGSAIIVCHNHPSGLCNPSKEDIETTKVILKAAEILGITLLDHIIISNKSYISFLEHDMLSEECESDKMIS